MWNERCRVARDVLRGLEAISLCTRNGPNLPSVKFIFPHEIWIRGVQGGGVTPPPLLLLLSAVPIHPCTEPSGTTPPPPLPAPTRPQGCIRKGGAGGI